MTAPATPRDPFRRAHTLAMTGFLLALLCGITLFMSGLGYRLGWWGLRTAFTILRWSAYGGAVAALVSLGAIAAGMVAGEGGRVRLAIVGLLGGLVVVGMPWSQLRRARRAPPIHDITTDTANPPPFVAVLPLRANAPNKAEYGGAEIAAKQHAAYPDLKPALLPVPPLEAFRKALATARDMGWDIVAADSTAGRIEATATTFWYGFKDDVVVRLTPSERGTVVDVRSESRVGGSDIGTNARRIREYLKRLAPA